ncbi:MAG: hypothetical protein IH623_10595 [Verrucomicrobia bacterium]|nr:hypothetical protein [Verrucomicrobiota bacterium]
MKLFLIRARGSFPHSFREEPRFLQIAGDLLTKTSPAAQWQRFITLRRHSARPKDEAGARPQ